MLESAQSNLEQVSTRFTRATPSTVTHNGREAPYLSHLPTASLSPRSNLMTLVIRRFAFGNVLSSLLNLTSAWSFLLRSERMGVSMESVSSKAWGTDYISPMIFHTNLSVFVDL